MPAKIELPKHGPVSKPNLRKRLGLIVAQLEREALVASAARRLAEGDDYCDFFVENNNGGPFHEKCPDDIFLGLKVTAEKYTSARMSGLKRFRAAATDCYPDFFVEGSGPAWHEKIDDFSIRDNLVRPDQRAYALRRSTVLQAFTRVADQVSAGLR